MIEGSGEMEDGSCYSMKPKFNSFYLNGSKSFRLKNVIKESHFCFIDSKNFLLPSSNFPL